LGLGFSVGDVITGAGFRTFAAEVIWLWTPIQRAIFGSSCFWNLGYYPSL